MKFVFKVYRNWLSPAFHSISRFLSGNPYTGCRFEPTCSCYTEQAIQKFGTRKGIELGIKRVMRCHPFSKSRGYDPV